MKKFLISDPHFSHAKIIEYVGRPFKDVNEMNDVMISNWNQVVTKYDQVYVLGDFYVGRSKEECDSILNKLNGNKFLIIGNHDQVAVKCKDKFGWMKQIYELSLIRQFMVLCHYPMLTWNKAYSGTYHAHGHVHNNKSFEPRRNVFNACVEMNDYMPIELTDVIAKIQQQNLTIKNNFNHK